MRPAATIIVPDNEHNPGASQTNVCSRANRRISNIEPQNVEGVAPVVWW
jgi:hypothetical protein